MVRFENLIYERLLNVKVLGRARVFATPKKWYNEPRHEAMKVTAQRFYVNSIFAGLFRMLEPIIAKGTYQWVRDIALQRGLALEDFFLHKDRELRRCYIFETVLRQSCHPYQWVLFRRRRARYYKVERGLRGCYVPEFIRQEAESRLLVDTVQNKQEWSDFMYNNYISDMTPCTRPSIIPKLIPLELFNQYKLFSNDGWERYFFNEINYGSYSEKEIRDAQNMGVKVQVNDPISRKNFEDEVNRFIKLYPGSIVKEGEKFDFEGYYAKLSKGTVPVEIGGIAKLKYDLKGRVEDKNAKKEKKKLGVSMPSAFVRSARKSLFLN